jgi:LCP family protein required for cell wall assembly
MSEEPRWGPAHEYRARPRWRSGRPDRPTGRESGRRSERQQPAGHGSDWYEEPAPAPRAQRPPRLRRRGRFGTILLLLVLLLIAYPVALGVVGYQAVHKVGPLPEGTVTDGPGYTVLMVGSDSREGTEIGGGGGARTDTIMLLHRPSGGGPTVLLSVPRDSYVEIPGKGSNKINAAYAFGGPALLIRTIEQATGIGIDGYVETDLAHFPSIVDAVGGVEMCPAEPMQDPKADLDVPAGCQVMDGTTALGYARTRAGPRGDLGRVERQRELIAAISKEATKPTTLINPFQAFPLARSAGGALSVDDGTGPFDLARFALAMKAVSGGNALTLTVPVADATRRTDAGVVVDWNEEKAQQVFQSIQNDDTEAIRPIAEDQSAG